MLHLAIKSDFFHIGKSCEDLHSSPGQSDIWPPRLFHKLWKVSETAGKHNRMTSWHRNGFHINSLVPSKFLLQGNGHVTTVLRLNDDVITWKHFPRYWPFVNNSPVTGEFPLKASNAKLWCFLWSVSWINVWVNNPEAGNLKHQCAHYDVIVMAVLWLDKLLCSY